ncbi:LCP family protein [Streptococcus merionis]|uniref:glycopolymer--peptidoglycan transferase LytR n=1 Tax=Streptococcus merionis TaxID=400065 RepID=UPI0026F0E2DB|nr:LCP family protein [Streptococcus merionis]
MTIGKKIAAMLTAIILTTLGAFTLYFFTIYNATASELSKTYTPFSKKSNEVIEATDPLTILFMGVDTGTGSREDDWVGNSDSMILVTVNPDTKTTTMMSLERDILVDISKKNGEPSGAQAKLNAAYAEGGAQSAIATIEDMMNIQIDRYAMINMQGLIDLVDAVGGITVNNTFDFDISIEEQEPEYTATIPPGVQKVNGEQALVYARMRYQDPEGDYGRQKRQREVIQLIVAKLLSMNSVSSYNRILKAVSGNVQTDVEITTETIPQLLGYRDALKNIKTYQLAGLDATIDGVSYQIVATDHMLEMQNILQTSLGRAAYTDVVTTAVLYETLYGAGAETPDYTGNEGTSSYYNGTQGSAETPAVVTNQAPTYDQSHTAVESPDQAGNVGAE